VALSPIEPITDDTEFADVTEEDVSPIPTRTYALDLDTGEIGGIIDGEDAIRQFIRKAVLTARFRFLIYDDEYGCELEDLIGQDVSFELLNSEIPRVITEALIYDDRVEDVTNFDIQREGDKLFIAFTVVLTSGNAINEEVTI
jgi:phage baseplate assembly protein W